MGCSFLAVHTRSLCMTLFKLIAVSERPYGDCIVHCIQNVIEDISSHFRRLIVLVRKNRMNIDVFNPLFWTGIMQMATVLNRAWTLMS